MNQQLLEDREVYTFCAGPCILPKSVLKQTQDEFMNYKGTGLSICEINHRGKEYAELNQNVMDGIKKLLNVPDNYKIMLTQGGSTSLNSAIPFNIAQQDDSANYLVTGLWGKNSQAESTKFVNSHLVTEIPDKFVRIPKTEEWNVKADAKYFYYIDRQ